MQGGQDGNSEDTLTAAPEGDTFLTAMPSWPETQIETQMSVEAEQFETQPVPEKQIETQMCVEAEQFETQPVPSAQGASPQEDENVRLPDTKHLFSECVPWQQDRRLCAEIDENADAQQPMELDELWPTRPLPHYDARLDAAMPSVPLVGEVPPRTPALPPCTSGPETQEEALQMQAGRLPAECTLEAFGRYFVGRLPASEQNAVF